MRRTTRQRPTARVSERLHGTERATALVLVPAITLVFLALGSIAVDLSALHGAQRAVHRVVSASADDAAGMIDTREVQLTGDVRIDETAARRVVEAHLATSPLPGDLVRFEVEFAPDRRSLTVEAVVRVEHIMLRAVPGAGEDEVFVVAATARLIA